MKQDDEDYEMGCLTCLTGIIMFALAVGFVYLLNAIIGF